MHGAQMFLAPPARLRQHPTRATVLIRMPRLARDYMLRVYVSNLTYQYLAIARKRHDVLAHGCAGCKKVAAGQKGAVRCASERWLGCDWPVCGSFTDVPAIFPSRDRACCANSFPLTCPCPSLFHLIPI
jgi:hypothetical protein